MEDIAPELLEKIKKDFKKKLEKSETIKAFRERVKEKTATYKDANDFAIETGELLADAFQSNLSKEILPDGKMYYNIADRVIRERLEHNYDITAEAAVEVQKILNEKAGIGIKAIKPEMNEDRVQGIINIVSGGKYDDVAYILGEAVVNFTQSVIDAAVKENADFHLKSGLRPKIRRTSTGKCCEWCNRLTGVYDYEAVSDTGNDVFRRHKHCRCTVEYDAGDGKVTNVHTKKTTDKDNIERRIENANKAKKETARSKEYYVKKAKEISRNNLDGMNLKELREAAMEARAEYYKQGLSGVDFREKDLETVVRKLAEQGNRTSLKKDIVSVRNKLRDYKKNDIIKPNKTIKGHNGAPKKAEAGTVIDHIGKDEKVDARTFYGESNLKTKDIHTTAHGNPRQHPYGKHGEHVHDYTWGDDERLKNKTTRELSEEERKENRDIL